MIYFYAFAPITWKKGRLRTLVRLAYTVCSNYNILQEKLHHIESCFTAINGYPKWLLKQTLNSLKTSNKSYNNKINNKNTNDTYINKLSNALKPVYSGHAI